MNASGERVVSIESGGAALHGVLHVPAQPTDRALVFCHPFAEEKKCAHRAMVDAARACAEAGWAALRFDLRGCGDSPGVFAEQTLDGWRADMAAALDAAERETGAGAVGLLGLRLGATLAAQVAEERPEIARLALWEPIVDGAQYLQENLRRSAIKAMVTRHEGGEAAGNAAREDAAPGEGTVDFDGYQVSERLREQIAAINLLTEPRGYAGPTLVANLTPREAVAEPLAMLATAYRQGWALAVRQEPIWQRIGVTDASPTIEATLDWLKQLDD